MKLITRISIGAATAGALALGVFAGTAAAAPPIQSKTAAVQPAAVAPMALPSSACGGITQNTLFVRPGTSLTAAQLQSAFGVAVRDTTRTMHQAPGAGPRIYVSGGSWASGVGGATALLESTADFQSRRYYQVVWQDC